MNLKALELKIPPPAVAALLGLAMWGAARILPSRHLAGSARTWIALPLAALAVAIALAAVSAFARARTTINPTTPQDSSSLVASGVFSMSRNPMYLSLLVLLVAWAVFLSSVWVLAGPIVFVCYMNRFQILPEERALAQLFGAQYAAYQARVRRWL